MRAPEPRIGPQLMIDVQRPQAQCRLVQARERCQQRGGVHPAAEGDTHRQVRELRQELRQAGAERSGAELARSAAPPRGPRLGCVLGKYAEAGDLVRARRAQLITRIASSSSR